MIRFNNLFQFNIKNGIVSLKKEKNTQKDPRNKYGSNYVVLINDFHLIDINKDGLLLVEKHYTTFMNCYMIHTNFKTKTVSFD